MEENGNISQDISLPGLVNICSPEITCFLNGLICSMNEDWDELGEIDIRIFNAITHDTVLLPRGSPSKVVPTVGIAFDPRSDDFKAFRFFSDSPQGDNVKCEVYTSGSTAWNNISEDVQRPEYSTFHPVCPYYASVGGVMYWFMWSQDKPGIPILILSVDMNDNFTEIDLPAQVHHWSFLIELDGCLTVVHVNNSELRKLKQYDDSQFFVELYKLENHGWNLRSKAMISLINVKSFNSVAARDNEIFFIIKHLDESFCYLIFDFVEKTFNTLDLEENFFCVFSSCISIC